ncbi:MAG: Rrf2 family transcriptional regulator [Clostridia bacterium]|nr:Rrf2 family transcriptional regulator [Clostridia bacterium]
MQLTQATDYSFRVVLYLAALDPGAIVSAKDISTHENVPMRFLLKTLRSLVKAGILRSYRGPDGGYALAKQPENITLRDVIEAVEGPLYINRCFIDEDYCSKHWTSACPVHRALGDVQRKLVQELDKHNFADLLAHNRQDQGKNSGRLLVSVSTG